MAVPRRGRIYTLTEVFALELFSLQPYLTFGPGIYDVVQQPEGGLLTLPGWAETEWQYLRMSAGVAIFGAVSPEDVKKLLRTEQVGRYTLHVPLATPRLPRHEDN